MLLKEEPMEGLECLDVSRPSNVIEDCTGRQIGKPSGRGPIVITQSGGIGDRPDHGPSSMVVGRRAELNVLAGMIDGVRAGGSATILIQGEPGVGKTALLLGVRQSTIPDTCGFGRCLEGS
jgi:hypothetical protein